MFSKYIKFIWKMFHITDTVVHLKTASVSGAEPVFGQILVSLFESAIIFLLFDIFIAMMLFAYREAKTSIAEEILRGEIVLISFYYYKLRHWLSRVRNLDFDTVGTATRRFKSIKSKPLSIILV